MERITPRQALIKAEMALRRAAVYLADHNATEAVEAERVSRQLQDIIIEMEKD